MGHFCCCCCRRCCREEKTPEYQTAIICWTKPIRNRKLTYKMIHISFAYSQRSGVVFECLLVPPVSYDYDGRMDGGRRDHLVSSLFFFQFFARNFPISHATKHNVMDNVHGRHSIGARWVAVTPRPIYAETVLWLISWNQLVLWHIHCEQTPKSQPKWKTCLMPDIVSSQTLNKVDSFHGLPHDPPIVSYHSNGKICPTIVSIVRVSLAHGRQSVQFPIDFHAPILRRNGQSHAETTQREPNVMDPRMWRESVQFDGTILQQLRKGTGAGQSRMRRNQSIDRVGCLRFTSTCYNVKRTSFWLTLFRIDF